MLFVISENSLSGQGKNQTIGSSVTVCGHQVVCVITIPLHPRFENSQQTQKQCFWSHFITRNNNRQPYNYVDLRILEYGNVARQIKLH